MPAAEARERAAKDGPGDPPRREGDEEGAAQAGACSTGDPWASGCGVGSAKTYAKLTHPK